MAVVFALLMITSVPAMAGISGSSGATETTQSTSADAIEESLRTADGTTEMIVRFESADTAAATSSADAVEMMQSQADKSQVKAQNWAAETDGVEFVESFWIANAALLEVDTDEVSPKEVLRYTGGERVHENFELSLPENQSDADESYSPANESANVTYGLDMINATEVWDEHDTQGGGAGVAVLDTGVDGDHPDIDIADENWQEFDSNGEPVDSEPNDGQGHGTHVSGTVSGSDDPAGDVPAFGVAPNAELYHGKVLDDSGGGTFAQIIAGMEWAVDDTDADVVSMSLGADGYDSQMMEPSENARNAGVVLVTSAGNSGNGISGVPGNIYPNFASGAVDAEHNVASFSSGEEIETAEAYPDAPEYWPDNYTVPNAAAPGVDVLSSVPGGGYDDTYSGTSMSAPHHAGAFALMIAASGGDADREMLYDAMEETAWKPADWDEPDDEYDTRYGMGIIDVAAATNMVALDSGIDGTVTDAAGEPIEGATVAIEDGLETETDANGEYSLVAPAGTHTVTVDGFGYESTSADVTVTEENTTVQDFELADALDAELADGQPDGVEGGDAINVTTTVANAETVTVDLAGDYDPADATLYVEGEEAAFGEPIDLGGPISGDLTITVETTEDTAGELSLEQTIGGMGDELTISTGPTMVFEEYVPVAVVDDAGAQGEAVADTLDGSLPEMYDPVVTTSEDAMDGYDVIVVQNIETANADEFVSATEEGDTGVVYLDQWSDGSNGVPAHSNATGEPESTFEDDLVSPPLGYELTADHEIFEGVGEAGDTVDLHNALFGDHTWFEGTEYDVLAETTVTGESVGSGFAVDDESSTILASNLGYTAFVTGGDYTADADAILSNSVEYLVSGTDEQESALMFGEGDYMGSIGETTTVEINTSAEAVAGYETQVHFDPDVVQVEGVEGVDFADPVTSIDNENGTVSLAQAQSSTEAMPTLAEIDFEFIAESDTETDLVFDEDNTYLNDEAGEVNVTLVNGTIASAWPGDVNADGTVNTLDATFTQQYLSGEEPNGTFHEELADMNDNGEVDAGDVTSILEEIVNTHGIQALA
ncbi:S8 family serine peptidase [Natrialba taiwanensis]|uniref:Subtilisin-like serine protease n=1 Tax=Natrialba taiwanensis DSM 12281 TaxID=1230458 RepID=L9ZPS3_9EURY|nr:S8 family serine peptidase [Natrialba taiwanensis]ELY88369.1 subtilisin-like serine protease [Natrialba taiwanensis DSM 12281]